MMKGRGGGTRADGGKVERGICSSEGGEKGGWTGEVDERLRWRGKEINKRLENTRTESTRGKYERGTDTCSVQ